MTGTISNMASRNRYFDVLFLIAYCGLIFWLSSQPSLPSPDLFPQQDKLIHAIAYAIMAWLAWFAYGHWIKARLFLVLTTVIFCMAYGLSDEWHQSFVPGRDASLWDWCADSLGAMLMVLWTGFRSSKAGSDTPDRP